MSEVNNDLGTNVVMTVQAGPVANTPIDDTLLIEGAAADAKAVGDALSLKADRSELPVAINVNGQSADDQGLILVTGADIDVSDSDETTVAAAISALDAKTAADIPMSSELGAESIADAIANGLNATADEIPLEEGSTTTVADELARLDSAKGTVKTVNGKSPTSNGNVQVEEVAYARNLVSDSSRAAAGTFIDRLSGGGASLGDGNAYLQQMRGAILHTGVVEEVLTMDITETSGITAELDRDEFIAAVDESSVITLSYTTEWSEDPADYGVTVTGTPNSGDQIVITYVKEDRGTITPATPTAFVATGWNLYQSAVQYARVLKYDYKYHVGGTYTGLTYSATPTGNQTTITPVNGSFDIPADGYVHVIGGSSDTYITPEWQDWTDGPTGTYAAYSESTIDISSLFGDSALFKYGLLAVGNTYDVIDFEMGQAISRIDRMAYNATNAAAAAASGRAWEADEDYIYIVKAIADTEDISSTMDGVFTASDHGIEMIDGTGVPVYCLVLYGNNLKNKLERDVVTLSAQELTSGQQSQARENIGAAATADIPGMKTALASGAGGASMTVDANMVALIVGISGNPTTHSGMWIVRGAATLDVYQVAAGSAVSYSVNGRTITFSHSSSRSTQYVMLEIRSFA